MFLKLTSDQIISKISVKQNEDIFKQVSTYLTNVLNSGEQYLPTYYSNNNYLGISFSTSRGTVFLYLFISDTRTGLNKGDEILFYFNNTDTVIIKLDGGNVRFQNGNMNIAYLSLEQIGLFLHNSIEYWILTKKNGLIIESDGLYYPENCRLENRDDFNVVMNYMVNMVLKYRDKSGIIDLL